MYKYKLIFSNQTNLLNNIGQDRVEGVYHLRSGASDSLIVCVRQGFNITGYEYNTVTQNWQQHWSEQIFNNGHYPASNYPWYVSDIINKGRDEVIIRHIHGLRFYQLDLEKPGLQLLASDRRFDDLARHKLLLGNFYPSMDDTGMISRNYNGIKFYLIDPNLLAAHKRYSVLDVPVQSVLSSVWSAPDTDISLTKLHHHGQEIITLRHSNALEFYRFNGDSTLTKILHTEKLAKPTPDSNTSDHLFFGNFTNQIYQDILHLNVSGLYVYQYNNAYKDYISISHNQNFSKSNHWLPRYSDSIKLFDINEDGADDLLFTDANGLTALGFDIKSHSWQNLLDPTTLELAKRHDQVVGVLPAMPSILPRPIIFTQSANLQELHFAEVSKDQGIEDSNHKIEVLTGTPANSANMQDDALKISKRIDAIIPQVKEREYIVPKPRAVWRDNWSADLFKDAVDSSSGTVHFTIPLIDPILAKKLSVSLSLHYNSKASSEGLIGAQWYLPIGQDYISIDHQNSIYPEDAKYHLILNGARQELQLISSNGEGNNDVWQFKLAGNSADALKDSATIITYNKAQECFIIENSSFKAVYGTAVDAKAKDALQKSLSWPNWRGVGSDASSQEQCHC